MAMVEENKIDDTTMQLQLQGFLDEWHFRVLHAGLASTWDRSECAVAAMKLFELCGLALSEEEMQDLAQKEELEMINIVVQKMSNEVRKNFENMTLQLTLVMSAASRVRCALDEGAAEDVARMMDDGDAGVNQTILKQTVLQAGKEVAEQREIHESWEANMTKRVARMQNGYRDAEHARKELDQINSELKSFGSDQNEKSKRFLTSMAGNNDKVLMLTTFQGWHNWHVKYRMEKDIHDKFQNQIDNATNKLFEYKAARVANIKNVMMRTSDDAANLIVKECFKSMAKNVLDVKEEAELSKTVKDAADKMSGLKAAQKDNAKKSMARMCAGNDESLTTMVFQEWVKMVATLKQDKEMEAQVKEQEVKFAAFMKSKSDQAKGVLQRMTGSSDSGLLFTAWKAWMENYAEEKKGKEMEELMQANEAKFKNLNARMKDNAKGKSGRAIDIEQDNLLMACLMNWCTEARVQKVVAHYGGQLDNKKHQLEAVQTMFQSFASQLEKGIESTPRKEKSHKSAKSSSRAQEGKPPSNRGAA